MSIEISGQGTEMGSLEDKTKGQSPVTLAYLANRHTLSSFLHLFFRSQEDVEDFMQESFVRAYAAEHRTKVDSPVGYLFRTARNLMLNESAKQKGRRTDNVADLDDLAVLYEEQIAGPSDPETAAMFTEELESIRDMVDGFPPRVREVFVLRKIFEMKQKEIAVELGISESTVEKHIARGLKLMKQARNSRK